MQVRQHDHNRHAAEQRGEALGNCLIYLMRLLVHAARCDIEKIMFIITIESFQMFFICFKVCIFVIS